MRYLHASAFFLPGAVAVLLLGALATLSPVLYVPAIALGVGKLLAEANEDIKRGNWSLDYIALLAMVLSLATHEWLAGTVISLMYVGGAALETYASRRANASLSALLARIPKTAAVKQEDGSIEDVPLADVAEHSTIVIRGGELVPLDGTLVSDQAVLNLANLTGEPLPETMREGAFIKSGSINEGAAFDLRVSGSLATSTYAKIVDLVRDAEAKPAPFVRLADRANMPFTLLTLLISSGTFLLTGDWTRVLAVLVIATPCPLIIAAPVAFIGGLSKAAGRNIIVKTPAALEGASHIHTVFFDKTGTLTLGTPKLTRIEMLADDVSENKALSVAASLELHSIHPLARALVAAAKERGFTPAPAEKVTEIIGTGVAGTIGVHYVSIEQAPKDKHTDGIALQLSDDGDPVAIFHLADELKDDTKALLETLTASGKKVAVLTGDRKAHAEEAFKDVPVDIIADLEPEDKYRLVEEAKQRGERVAMVGDGLNDAPALAKADIGIVFSGTENSAAIEAADIAILGHDAKDVAEVFALAERSVRIAGQSVWTGIGLSIIGQAFAAAGYIPPVTGAILQEGIDVAVILNALRSALGNNKKTPKQ